MHTDSQHKSVLDSAHCTAMRGSSHGTKESQSGLDAQEGPAQGKNGRGLLRKGGQRQRQRGGGSGPVKA